MIKLEYKAKLAHGVLNIVPMQTHPDFKSF